MQVGLIFSHPPSSTTSLQVMTVENLPAGEWEGSGSSVGSVGNSLSFSSLVREPVSMVVSRSGISSATAVGESAAGAWRLCSVHSFLWLLIRSRSFFSVRLGAGSNGTTANRGKMGGVPSSSTLQRIVKVGFTADNYETLVLNLDVYNFYVINYSLYWRHLQAHEFRFYVYFPAFYPPRADVSCSELRASCSVSLGELSVSCAASSSSVTSSSWSWLPVDRAGRGSGTSWTTRSPLTPGTKQRPDETTARPIIKLPKLNWNHFGPIL